MLFKDWLATAGHGALKRIEHATGVGYTTLQRARRSEPLHNYSVAKKVSDATGGAVSALELMEPGVIATPVDPQRSKRSKSAAHRARRSRARAKKAA